MSTRENSDSDKAMERAAVDLILDYLHDRITKEEFEKRKLRLELKGLKVEKVSSPAPAQVQAAADKFNGSTRAVEAQKPHEVERGCPDDSDNVQF